MQTSIDVLTTTKPDVQAMAREFRKSPGFKDLHVILVKISIPIKQVSITWQKMALQFGSRSMALSENLLKLKSHS